MIKIVWCAKINPMEAQLGNNKIAILALRRSWRWYTLASGLMIAGGFALLSATWDPSLAALWAILPALAMGYQSQILLRNLDQNHRLGEEAVLSELGWGNRLTLLRGMLVGAMMGFLLLPKPEGWLLWLPGILYMLSDAADFFDGYVARVTNHATHLGEVLDMSFDGLGVLAASILAVQYGQVPVWYILVGGARYLFLAGMTLRTRLDRPNHPLPHSLSRRVFAGLQMGFLAAILLPIFSPPGTWIAASLFGLPLLVGFTRDWLYVSGILRANRQIKSASLAAFLRWLPFGLRLSVVALSLPALLAWAIGFPDLPLALQMLGLLNLLVVALLALGVMPRILAIVLLCVLGFYQMFDSLNALQISLGVIATLILYIGGGPWCAFAPEETLFERPAGVVGRRRPEIST